MIDKTSVTRSTKGLPRGDYPGKARMLARKAARIAGGMLADEGAERITMQGNGIGAQRVTVRSI